MGTKSREIFLGQQIFKSSEKDHIIATFVGSWNISQILCWITPFLSGTAACHWYINPPEIHEINTFYASILERIPWRAGCCGTRRSSVELWPLFCRHPPPTTRSSSPSPRTRTSEPRTTASSAAPRTRRTSAPRITAFSAASSPAPRTRTPAPITRAPAAPRMTPISAAPRTTTCAALTMTTSAALIMTAPRTTSPARRRNRC
ncbi:hypothetical protein BS78_01G499000 [Paspalum vaginatum]|nr:hypothetical protein BS78_01G499000 [Paspalum vaginatum]